MKKIDLIIFALESAINNIPGDDTEDYCIEALTTARELRDAEPVGYQVRMKADWESNWQEWNDCSENVANDFITNTRLPDGCTFEVRKLYTLGDADE